MIGNLIAGLSANLVTLPVTVEYLVIGGGGGGAGNNGGGGGAGGYRTDTNFSISLSTSYTLTVGAGGVGGSITPGTFGTAGDASSFSTISSAGGGRGAIYNFVGGDGG